MTNNPYEIIKQYVYEKQNSYFDGSCGFNDYRM